MKLHSPDETCEILGFRKTTFYKFLKEGRLRAIKIGKLTKVPKDSIEEFIKNSPAYKEGFNNE